jgi:hypothetical protein
MGIKLDTDGFNDEKYPDGSSNGFNCGGFLRLCNMAKKVQNLSYKVDIYNECGGDK